MKSKRGFSLIELLVIMGILVLLGIITAGVFTSVSARSKETSCISNLHQIGLAVRMYMEDYDAQPAVRGVPTSPYALGLPPRSATTLFYTQYVKSRPVLLCPSYHRKTPIDELSSTYSNHMMFDPSQIEEVKPWIAKKGDGYALYVCHEHFPGVISAGPWPSWQRRKVNILRINMQVDSKMYPMQYMAYDY